jgi:hypothetical protein
MLHPAAKLIRRMCALAGWAILWGALTASPAAQSVADLARKKGEKEKQEATRTYTNRDLKKARGNLARSTLDPAAPSTAGKTVDPAGGDDSPEGRYYHECMEALDWLEYARQAQETAVQEHRRTRIRLENALPVKQVIFTQDGYATFWYQRADPATVARLEQSMERCERQLQQADADLAAARQALEELRLEARRRGIGPGVYRQALKDWEERQADGR